VDQPDARWTSSFSWNGATGSAWLAHAEQLERQLEPVNGPLFEAAALRSGELVIDVGCGRGVTSRVAAGLVAPDGAVIAVDVAEELIRAARHELIESEAAPIDWVVADAQRYAFAPERADVVLSRFGVMFFDDPAAAFANLHAAVRLGGRLAVVVWQPRDASPLHARVLDVVVATAARHGVKLTIDAPDAGVYSFGVADRVCPLLEGAGWVDVRFVPHTLPLHVGGTGASPAEAARTRLEVGPVEVLLREVPPEVKAAVSDAVRAEFESHWDGLGVRFDAGIAIVTARRP
jgi:SAM-dependent methyltransferase